MEAQEIIKNISTIYQGFKLPKNLQRHMLRVGAVAKQLTDNWEGPKINKDLLIASALLHDLGNITKLRIENGKVSFLEEGEPDANYWLAVKKEQQEKYGEDDHHATVAMAKEIGADNEILQLLKNKDWRNMKKVMASTSWELKLCLYADYRVGPFGILSLKERIDDLKKRYQGRPKFYIPPQVLEFSIAETFRLEQELFEQLSISPQEISDQSIAPFLKTHKVLGVND